MEVITPSIIVDGLLDESNIPEEQPPEPAEWLTATSFNLGDETSVVLGTDAATITHAVYASQFDGSQDGNDPTTQGTDKTFWKFVRSTVRWAMFNEILQDQSVITVDRQDGLTLPGGAGNYANSPSITFPTGKITILAQITPTDGTPVAAGTIFSKYTESGDQRTVAVLLNTDGRIELRISSDGTLAAEIVYVSTDISGLVDATVGWIKIEFDNDDGVNSVATFFASLDDEDAIPDVEFTQLGAPITDIQTSLFVSSALLEIGSNNVGANDLFIGSIQHVCIYDGLNITQLIAEYNRINMVTGSTSFSFNTQQTWTEQGSAAFTQDIPGIVVLVTPSGLANAAAFLNMENANSVRLVFDSATDGIVLDQTFNLLSFSGINNIFSWLFDPVVRKTNLVILNLPSFRDITIRAYVIGQDDVKIGALVIGDQFNIGTTLYDAAVGLQNFSQKSTDQETGAVTVLPGRFKATGKFDVIVEPNRYSVVFDKLVSLRDIPAVYVGDEDISAMIQYAYYNNFNQIFSNFADTICRLSTEGLS